MKYRYRLVKVGSRGGIFYYDDVKTKARKSLRTADEDEALRLVNALNEAEAEPMLTRKIGMAYQAKADPEYATRTWRDVMTDLWGSKPNATV
jgi:hypothetical protein